MMRAACIVVGLLALNLATLRAQSSAVELNEAGWKALDAGDVAGAARLFGDALKQRPDEPVLLFGASVAAQLQGRSAEAKPKLQRALQVNPRFTPASLLLGQILYRESDLEQAIKVYESALALSPGQPELISRLAAWKKEADVHNAFTERRQDRFRVLFEGRTDAQLAARTTDSLMRSFWRIGQELRTYPSDPIVVILYTEKQFRDITRAPEWSNGLYDGRIRLPVGGASASSLFDNVAAHELAHAMITSIAPRGVPTWLHEGLAQHFQGENVQAAKGRMSAHRQRIPLNKLEGNFTGLTAAGALVAYDESLLAVEAIIARARISWSQVLYALADSDNPSETLRGFGIVYSELEQSFDR